MRTRLLLTGILCALAATSWAQWVFNPYTVEYNQTSDSVFVLSEQGDWLRAEEHTYTFFSCDSIVRNRAVFDYLGPQPPLRTKTHIHLNPGDCSFRDSLVVYDSLNSVVERQYTYYSADTLINETPTQLTKRVERDSLLLEEIYVLDGQGAFALNIRVVDSISPNYRVQNRYVSPIPGSPVQHVLRLEVIGDTLTRVYTVDITGAYILNSERTNQRTVVGNQTIDSLSARFAGTTTFVPVEKRITYNSGFDLNDSTFWYDWDEITDTWKLYYQRKHHGLTANSLDSLVDYQFNATTGLLRGGTRVLFTYDPGGTGTFVAERQPIQLRVFPNPAQQFLTIQADRTLRQVDVYNMLGAHLLHQRVIGSHTVLPLEQVSPGMYLVRIQTDDGEYTRQVVIE